MSSVVGFYIGTVADATNVDSARIHTVGKLGYDALGNVYVYLKGNTSIAAGKVVSYDPTTFAATILPTSGVISKGLAVAVSAVNTTSLWGWFMVRGQANVAVDSAVKNGDFVIVPGTTAGQLTRYANASPAFQSGAVYGICPSADAASNLSLSWINYPYTTVVAAS